MIERVSVDVSADFPAEAEAPEAEVTAPKCVDEGDGNNWGVDLSDNSGCLIDPALPKDAPAPAAA